MWASMTWDGKYGDGKVPIWQSIDQKGSANILWHDTYITEEFVKRLNPYQKVNHFPNSFELGKKNHLSENLNKMKQSLPAEYNFFPSTWTLPEEREKLQKYSYISIIVNIIKIAGI